MNPKSAVLLLMIGSAITAPSQVHPPQPSAWSAGVGIFYPGDRAERDRTGKTHFQLSISYELPSHDPRLPRLGAFADFSTRTDERNRLGVLGLGVQVRQSIGIATGPVKPYVRGGIGTYSLAIKENGKTEANGGRIGGFLTLGVDVKQRFFVEAGYRFASKFRGINASGALLTLGYRF
jgi:Outer membrane protein beta-barrel domain